MGGAFLSMIPVGLMVLPMAYENSPARVYEANLTYSFMITDFDVPNIKHVMDGMKWTAENRKVGSADDLNQTIRELESSGDEGAKQAASDMRAYFAEKGFAADETGRISVPAGFRVDFARSDLNSTHQLYVHVSPDRRAMSHPDWARRTDLERLKPSERILARPHPFGAVH